MHTINTSSVETFLEPYLPPQKLQPEDKLFITSTWAQSLDARIAAAPNERTRLSGMYTKKMTHFVRSRHDAILIGKTTLISDDPQLNCRYSPDANSPIPIIIDTSLSIPLETLTSLKVFANVKKGYKPPIFITGMLIDNLEAEVKTDFIKSCGGHVLSVVNTRDWHQISEALKAMHINSVMVEGGSQIIDTCMASGLVDSVVITIAPTFLGKFGVDVAPTAQYMLNELKWWSLPDVPDAVVAGRLSK